MLSSFWVGGHARRWEYFVAGEPIEQMSIAADEATSGQVVVSAHSHELLLRDGGFSRRLKFVSELTEGGQYLLKEIIPLEKGKPAVQLSGRHLLNDLQAKLR